MKTKQTILFGTLASTALASTAQGISVVAHDVMPYDSLKVDRNGMKIHSGTTSAGQDVHSVHSKIEQTGGKPAMLTLNVYGSEIKILATDAEVAFAQLLPKLASVNQGAGA